jgi:hypothetical protein
MLSSMLKVMAATAVFGAVHSALASRTAKQAAARTFGERNRNGLYRVFYLAQSAVTFGLLASYIRKQPSRELYRAPRSLAMLMHAAQAGAAVYATSAAAQVGISRMLGAESLRCWLGDGPVPPEPEAQGPGLDALGKLRVTGPFAWSRHPLNFAPLPILWLWPRMTTNLFAFNTAASIYLFLGSRNEEARLRVALGEEYETYQNSDVPFFIPAPNSVAGGAAASIAESRRVH